MATSRDERIRDLVNMIEDPDEQVYAGNDDPEEIDVGDVELNELGEFYEEEDVEMVD
ncbi:MAG: hypothetical protein ACR2NQ_05660 [Thermodesulfobacteriota bacterium]